MNRKCIFPIMAAVVAGLVAYGVTRNMACGRERSCLNALQDLSLLTRELGLSRTQATAIAQLHANLAVTLKDCCARHCAARARLGAALASETNGTAQADAIVTEMCRAYEQSERATLEQIRQVRATLNPEQRTRFDAMISECVCQTCDMPGGKVPSGPMKHESCRSNP